MNENGLDAKLVVLVEEYIDKFIAIPPIFCTSLSENRKKEILNQAISTNTPIDTMPAV